MAIASGHLNLAHRLPALDGLRALAISLVILSHSLWQAHYLDEISMILGHLGVTMFMVLSGYLITRVMLVDESRSSCLRIGRFYGRRARRILPALFVFLIGVWLLARIGVLAMPNWTTWMACLFFFRNMVGTGWDTGHLWSLSLEEQFYLAWPALFALFRRRRLLLICGMIALIVVWRTCWLQSHASAYALTSRFDLRADTFLMGAAFAVAANWKWVQLIPGLAFSVSVPLCYFDIVPVAVRSTAIAFLIAALIRRLVDDPSGRGARLLSLRWPVALGMCSYSLYLWQQLFLGPEHFHWIGLPVLAGVVCLSYFLVERPFLSPRHQVSQGWSLRPLLSFSGAKAISESQD